MRNQGQGLSKFCQPVTKTLIISDITKKTNSVIVNCVVSKVFPC